MLPMVAAVAEPARAVTISAVRTGASSRVRLSATSEPTRFSLPKRTSTLYPCRVRTSPVKTAESATTPIDRAPMKSSCAAISSTRTGLENRRATPSPTNIARRPASPTNRASVRPAPPKRRAGIWPPIRATRPTFALPSFPPPMGGLQSEEPRARTQYALEPMVTEIERRRLNSSDKPDVSGSFGWMGGGGRRSAGRAAGGRLRRRREPEQRRDQQSVGPGDHQQWCGLGAGVD